MGQVCHGLNCPFEFTVPDLVQQNGQHNSAKCTEHQVNHAHSHRIAECQVEILVAKQESEVVPANPLTACQALLDVIILESCQPAPQGTIVKQQDIQKHGNRHNHQLILFPKRPEESFLLFRQDCSRGGCLQGHLFLLLSTTARGGETNLSPSRGYY